MNNRAAPAYAESVPSSRWTLVAVALAAAVTTLAGLLSLIAGERFGAVMLLLAGAVLGAVVLVFGRLAIRVDADELRFSFGPLGVRLPAARIEAVEVERYRWLPYGGWGIRFATAGRRAWSVPFQGQGVSVRTVEGTRYHLSSRRPGELAAAVEELRTRRAT
jgi:hypothetical protein